MTSSNNVTVNKMTVRKGVTVEEVIKNCGYKPDLNSRCYIGNTVEDIFQQKYGKPAEKCLRYVNGVAQKVKFYPKGDELLLEKEVHKYFARRKQKSISGAVESENDIISDCSD
eukprot:1140331-Rhodomonas_salina.1